MEWEEKGISKTHRSELFDNGAAVWGGSTVVGILVEE